MEELSDFTELRVRVVELLEFWCDVLVCRGGWLGLLVRSGLKTQLDDTELMVVFGSWLVVSRGLK
jgi:hypothetical protein